MAATIRKSPAYGIVVSLDALGTLYRFRAPLAVQYIHVAQQCGLTREVDAGRVLEAFKRAFKQYGSRYPNYGKNELANPEIWWTGLVNAAFKEVIGEKDIPPDLGTRLYEHFSSGAAYELYPDVKSFLRTMQRLQSECRNPNRPMIVLGVTTNSDPRVRQVLESLGLRVRTQPPAEDSVLMDVRGPTNEVHVRPDPADGSIKAPWREAGNTQTDFDFLATSYEAGYEKPNAGIFHYARRLGIATLLSRVEHQRGQSTQAPSRATRLSKAAAAADGKVYDHDLDNFKLIHVGDEYVKDYQGAQEAGFEALHLVRDGEGEERRPGAYTITNLDEVGAVIHRMVEENFGTRA